MFTISNRVSISVVFFFLIFLMALAFKNWSDSNENSSVGGNSGLESTPKSIDDGALVPVKAHQKAIDDQKTSENVPEHNESELDPSDYDDFLAYKQAFQERYNITPEDEEEHRRWFRERGLDLSYGYDSYSTETLKDLANQGDIIAMDMLANNIRRKGRNLVEAEKLYIESAIRGSLKAVDKITSIKKQKLGVAHNSGNPEEAEKIAVEVLVWMRVGEIRGYLDMPSGNVANFDSYLQKIGITLDLADYGKADTLAESMYEALEAERENLGLGAFDNSIPKVFEKMGLTKD